MKQAEKKIGLLIQGPIQSNGITGRYFGTINKHLIQQDHYNSSICIEKLINNYGALFDEIILCSWKEQVGGLKRQLNKNIKSYFLDKEKIPSFRNNMLNHFYGVRFGLSKFRNVDYVIKVRTDQYINLEKFLVILKKNKFFNRKIVIPFAMKKNISVGDFYFAGGVEELREFFNSLVKGDLHSKTPHLQIIYNYVYYKYSNELKVLKKFYYPPFNNYYSIKIYKYAINNIFQPFDREIYSNIIFRGYRMNNKHKEYAKKNFLFTGENFNYNILIILIIRNFYNLLISKLKLCLKISA